MTEWLDYLIWVRFRWERAQERNGGESECQVVKNPSPLPPGTLKSERQVLVPERTTDWQLFHFLAWPLFIFSMGIWAPSQFPLALYLSAKPAEGRG